MKTSFLPSAGAARAAPDSLFDEAVALIYASPQQPALRRRALGLMAELLGAAGAAHLGLAEDEPAPVLCEIAGSVPADFAAVYAAHGAAIDPRRRFLAAAPDGSLYVSHYDRDRADPRDALFFDGFLADCGIGESIGAQIAHSGGERRQIYIERALGAPAFAPAELHLFRRLVHHWREAEQLAEAAGRRTAQEALQRHLLDSLPLGALIADNSRRVLFANAAARGILAAGDGLSLIEGRLHAARAFETNALTAYLRAAALAAQPDGGALLVARPSGKRPWALLVVPLEPVRAEAGIAAARMTVLLADLDGRAGALAPRLMQLFGLSRAEARVAAGVVEGLRLREIARASAVRMPTVRTQMRAVLHKIGVTRQADLVRVALALPATLPATLPPRAPMLTAGSNGGWLR